MPVEVIMPRFGLTMHEGTIQRFFKAEGEAVGVGEPLYEVETEKVLYQVEAPASGTLAVRLYDDGATVDCGTVVAVIAAAGEDVRAIASRYASARGTQRASAAPRAPLPGAAGPTGGAERRPASPIARKLAAELGVELARVVGTGPGGRITRDDVERAAAAAPVPTAALPIRGIRKTIAERMHRSLQQSAQLTITTEADVTPATERRARLAGEFDFTYTDLIIYAVARALAQHPRMNARFGDGAIEMLSRVNVGMAVALDEGLIVPVIFDAERKSLREIAAQSRSLAEKARTGRLRLEDVTGGTFTVSNLGVWGVDAFTPILNPGETGILGVGRIVEKPAVYRGSIAKRSMMMLSLTFDHRTIDGAPAARFLQTAIEVFNRGEE